jgi:hypothetical protein
VSVVIVVSLSVGLAISLWVSDWIGAPLTIFLLIYGSRIAWSGYDDGVRQDSDHQPMIIT